MNFTGWLLGPGAKMFLCVCVCVCVCFVFFLFFSKMDCRILVGYGVFHNGPGFFFNIDNPLLFLFVFPVI